MVSALLKAVCDPNYGRVCSFASRYVGGGTNSRCIPRVLVRPIGDGAASRVADPHKDAGAIKTRMGTELSCDEIYRASTTENEGKECIP